MAEPALPGRFFRLLACVLMALVQAPWAGYQLGAGNQSIQIPFLLKLHDATLFMRDAMVTQTLGDYPSLFFAALSRLLSVSDPATLYLVLHLAVTAAVMLAVAGLCRAIFGDGGWGLIAMLLLLAGHHHALAGEDLYSPAFTHTWAALPLALLTLIFFYRDRPYAAFALAGALFNIHALQAGYLGLLLGFYVVFPAPRPRWWKVAGMLSLFVALASPTLVMMLRNRQAFDGAWVRLMQLRSADHSFPSCWWQAGNPGIPQFLLIVSLGALSMSFPMPAGQRRKTLWLGLAGGVVFLAGFLLTEVWPLPVVIRAQLYRSSRLIVVLALAHAAFGGVNAWRLVRGGTPAVARWRGWLEMVAAAGAILCLALPGLIVLLPLVVLVGTLVALINGRLAWYAALLAGAALAVSLLAWQSIHFVLPGLSPEVTLGSLLDGRGPGALGWLTLAAGVSCWAAGAALHSWKRRMLYGGLAFVVTAGLSVAVFGELAAQPPPNAAWVDVQEWARQHTPRDALFLTPTQPGGFRVFSHRAVVGEWRDGTQLYFSAAFGREWWQRMADLQPGMVVDLPSRHVFTLGKPLGLLEDDEIIKLCAKYHADCVVLPTDSRHGLARLYANADWAIYAPRPRERPALAAGAGAVEQQRFLEEAVLPNIDKNRRSDARVQVVDATGRPVYDLRYEIVQRDSPFKFGCTLPFFEPAGTDAKPAGALPSPEAARLGHFTELFNYSVIGPSGWWTNLEPEPSKRSYGDMDQYVRWCRDRGIEMEYHFISGFAPPWLRDKKPQEQGSLLLAHARDLVARYGEAIHFWQVVDLGIHLQQSPPLFEEARRVAPGLSLGIGDCARFFSVLDDSLREQDLYRGLPALQWLKENHVKVDFVALHAHRPAGLWADARAVYEVFDRFAREGVRIHVTELGVPVEGPIVGPVREGVWTPRLQADYLCELMTVCFSHPAVDGVNLGTMGPGDPLGDAGLFDERGNPRPSFAALKELITKRWRTRLSGKLALDGAVSFRGYHGQYELALTQPSGRVVKATFTVSPGESRVHRFKLDKAAGTLTLWPATP